MGRKTSRIRHTERSEVSLAEQIISNYGFAIKINICKCGHLTYPSPQGEEKLSVQLVSRGEEERLLAIRHTERSEVSLAVLV